MNFSWFNKLDVFGKTLVASALLHVILIFAVTFKPPEPKISKDKMPPLEVVLVNAKTGSAPTKADVLAQANLNRGGNTEENRKAKSALPPAKNKPAEVMVKPAAPAKSASKSAKAKAEVERKQQRVAELERQAQELMTQIQAQKKVETQPTAQAASPQPEQGEEEATSKNIDAAALVASSLDMVRLEAQIAKQQEEYQKRPKRKFIGARAQEYRFATYVESWRQKVEKVGNLNYPVEA
ncbi:MAG TPA: energy transducer TonB, partial [Methylophilaceae bacterium]|nr:energy transducer TonB [Methylophilaceae bacterium]